MMMLLRGDVVARGDAEFPFSHFTPISALKLTFGPAGYFMGIYFIDACAPMALRRAV